MRGYQGFDNRDDLHEKGNAQEVEEAEVAKGFEEETEERNFNGSVRRGKTATVIRLPFKWMIILTV